MLAWFFFLPASRKLRAYPPIFCQLPVQLLFVQGSYEPDRGLDTDNSELRALGPALTRLPGKWRRRCPLRQPSWLSAGSTHWPSGPFSPLCTQLALGSGNFLQDSAFFFFLTFLQTRMHEESREPWLACGTMLLVRTEESMHRKSKMPLGKDPTESARSENHSHSNLWGLLGVSSNREDNRKSNLSGK